VTAANCEYEYLSSFESPSLPSLCLTLSIRNPRFFNTMDLPPELLDKIISHLPDDKIYLQNCSLVAKSWVYPSQRRLFNVVCVWGDTELKSWSDAISPTNVGVLQHVRSLTCKIADTPGSCYSPLDFLRDYSPSFRQLERLTLLSGFLPSLDTQMNTYSAFQHTLSYLSLQRCIATASGLAALVNYFPNLAHLDLSELFHWGVSQPTHPLSRPLQKLTVTEFYAGHSLGLLDRFMELHPRCEEVTIRMTGPRAHRSPNTSSTGWRQV